MTAVGLFFITSSAKEGPEIIAIFFISIYLLIISDGNKPSSESMPLQAKIIDP